MVDGTSDGIAGTDGSNEFRFDGDPRPNGGNGKQPDNSVTGPNVTVDPATLAGSSTGSEPGSGKRKRGRPPGSGNKSKSSGGTAPKTPLDLGFFQFGILGIHTALAAITKIPEIALSEPEAETLAKAMANVAQYYPVAIDAKTQAWMALVMTAGTMYAPRFIAYTVRTKMPRNPPPDNVHPLHNVG